MRAIRAARKADEAGASRRALLRRALRRHLWVLAELAFVAGWALLWAIALELVPSAPALVPIAVGLLFGGLALLVPSLR